MFDTAHTRAAVEIIAPILTLLGILLSAYGTYDITRAYYPVEGWDFFLIALKVSYLYLRSQPQRAQKQIYVLAEYAINQEDRKETLAGLFLIFWGFVAQGIGAALWLIDAAWGAYLALHLKTVH